MGVPADDDPVGVVEVGEDLCPARQPSIDGHDLVVVARGAVAEHDGAEPGHVEPHRVRELVEEVDLVGPQLATGPVGDVDGGVASAGHLDQLPVGVAADQKAPVAEADQPVEDLDRHRAGRVVAGHDDPLGRGHVGLGENGVEHRKDAVDVGEDRDRRHHGASLTGPSAAGQRGRRVCGGLNTSSV